MSDRTFTPAHRSAEIIQPGSLDFLQWLARWEHLDQAADHAASDADADALWDQREAVEKAIVGAPCDSAAAAMAKLRILMAQSAPGASFADEHDYRIFQQVTAWLEAQLP